MNEVLRGSCKCSGTCSQLKLMFTIHTVCGLKTLILAKCQGGFLIAILVSRLVLLC